MRILHALNWYFPGPAGGTEVYVERLCAALQAMGHECAVAATLPGARDVEHHEHRGVPVFRYPVPSAPTRDEARTAVRARGAELFDRVLDEWAPDVVHIHSIGTGLDADEAEAARRAGCAVVITAHVSGLAHTCARGDLMHWGESVCEGVLDPARCAACLLHARGLPKSAARAVASIRPDASAGLAHVPGPLGTALGMRAHMDHNAALRRRLLDAAGAFVTLTAAAASVMRRNGCPEPMLWINRLGVAADIAPKPGPHAAPTKTPVRIGYLGRFQPLKGAAVLARALRMLPADLPFQAEFRGPAQSREDEQERARVLGIAAGDARITLAPAVTPAEVPAVLGGYDLLCCPSLSLEGGPTVALEALARGTPVIGSRIGGMAEFIEDDVHGRLVPPGDPRALAYALREAIESPARIDAWRRAARAPRTMDDVAREYPRIYESALARELCHAA